MYKQPCVLSVYVLFNVLFACINLFIEKNKKKFPDNPIYYTTQVSVSNN